MLCSNEISVGLELEYENVSWDYAMNELDERLGEKSRLWNFKPDNSLRPRERNTEMVFSRPLSGRSCLLVRPAG